MRSRGRRRVSEVNAESVDSDAPREGGAAGYVGVGASLRQAREETGQALGAAAAALRIRRPHLEAIEEGRFRELPGRVYAIGFIRAYADYLNLDADWVIDRFNEEVDPGASDPDLNFPEPPERAETSYGRILAAAAALAAVGYGGWYYLQSGGPPRGSVPEVPDRLRAGSAEAPAVVEEGRADGEAAAPSDPPEAAAAEPAAEGPLADGEAGPAADAPLDAPPPPVAANFGVAAPPAADPGPAPQTGGVFEAVRIPETAAEPAPPPAAGEEDEPGAAETEDAAAAPEPDPEQEPEAAEVVDGRVVLRARDETWVRLLGPDGARVLLRNLQPGESYAVPDRPGYSLTVGNAAGLAIEVDGVALPPLGEEGQVVRGIALDADELAAAR